MTNIIKNTINEIILLIYDVSIRWFGNKKQFFPTLEDINNKDIKELSKRLEGDSEKETLTNILEWQERNIKGWTDRMYMLITMISSYVITLVGFVISFIILIFIGSFSIFPVQIQTMMQINNIMFLSIVFGAFMSLMLYLIIKYKIIKRNVQEFKLKDIFSFSLPTAKILRYKLAICRDYAKLTASLLFNIYPSNGIFFFAIPWHVATGIEINNKKYVIDQKLPVLTWEKWLIYWKQKNTTVYISKLIKTSENQLRFYFKKYKKLSLRKDLLTKPIDTQKIQHEVVKILKISQISAKDKPDFELTFPKFATYYEDDEIVIYSMARAIKKKLENELCGNINTVSKIEIKHKKEDFVVDVYLNSK